MPFDPNKMLKISCLCLLLGFCVVECVSVSPSCKTSCSHGELCVAKECRPCPERFDVAFKGGECRSKKVKKWHYQNSEVHQYTYCKPWTIKPPNSHYVIAKNGTPSSDIEWICEKGYAEGQYTIDSFHCVMELPTMTSSTSSTAETMTAMKITSEDINTTQTVGLQKSNGETNKLEIILSIIIPLIVIFIIVIVILVARQRRVWCFKIKSNRNEPDGQSASGTTLLSSGTEPQTDPSTEDTYYNFFFKIVQELGHSLTKTFINCLDDPSGHFNLESTLECESEKNKDSIIYFTNSLVCWAKANNGVHMDIVQRALETAGRPNLLSKIENFLHQSTIEGLNINEGINGVAVNYRIASGSRDETKIFIQSSISKKPARFRLFYYLTDKLNDATDLLPHLTDSGSFSAYNYFKNCGSNDFKNSFAKTLEEWWQRSSGSPLNKMLDVLKELEVNSILDDDKFLELCTELDRIES